MRNLDDYRWLVSEAARPWLARAGAATEAKVAATLVPRLRKDLSAARAHLVVELTELRRRASEKFAAAEQMFFTRKGLEQATDERLANYKAARFTGDDPTLDLCCGLGGDLLALGDRGRTTGYDLDPIAVMLANANAAAVNSAENCAAIAADALTAPVGTVTAWHCDPDRRTEGKRTTRGEMFQPPLDALVGLLAQNPHAAIKLAPATVAPSDWSAAAELEWLGSRGECRQQVAWFGRLARHPGRRAASVIGPEGAILTVVGNADESETPAAALGCYVYEPHAAVLAARLAGALCRQHGLGVIAPGVAYLTGERLICDPALAAFKVRDVLPFDRKQLKGYCHEHGLGRLEIKKRGVNFEPQQLRREIAARGDGAATIIITPLGPRIRAIVVERIALQS